MPYINIPSELEGMRGLLAFRPAIAPALTALTETILRSDEGLNMGQRELIGAYVSSLNDCHICQCVHSALLKIAQSVQLGGKQVTPTDIESAKVLGASDLEIHETVLIAAAFCMFNRYVGGLGTFAPDYPEMYRQRAKIIAEETGYAGAAPF